MSKPNGKWSYNFSWNQPYLPTSYNPFYQSVRSAEIELELDRLDAVDLIVDQMDSFPEVEILLSKVLDKPQD